MGYLQDQALPSRRGRGRGRLSPFERGWRPGPHNQQKMQLNFPSKNCPGSLRHPAALVRILLAPGNHELSTYGLPFDCSYFFPKLLITKETLSFGCMFTSYMPV